MKIAPLMHEFARRADRFEPILVHTGQHYDQAMSDSFFKDLGIPEPDVNLGVGSGTHGHQTAQVLMKIEDLLIKRERGPRRRRREFHHRGDARRDRAHSGRARRVGPPSWDRDMPEEVNRILTDSVSHWLFTTEPSAEENLLREGIPREKIHFVGNVVIDALLTHKARAQQLDTLDRLGLESGKYAVLTLHRPSNVDHAERPKLFEVLGRLSQEIPVVFPIHPRTARPSPTTWAA